MSNNFVNNFAKLDDIVKKSYKDRWVYVIYLLAYFGHDTATKKIVNDKIDILKIDYNYLKKCIKENKN